MSCAHGAGRLRYFVPDGRGGFRPSHLLEWAEWFENGRGRVPFATGGNLVAFDKVEDTDVSTVFLGLDQDLYGDGPPILFETMIFGGPHDGRREQYATLAEAQAGHAAAVEVAKN